MFCAISGKPARNPVLSPNSKCIFEKNLLEQYVQENGKDPVSNQPMKIEDIIVISQTAQQSSLTSTVASSTLNTNYSIPSLLSTLQNEWDALMLENFKLRKQLDQMSKEFSTALFQRDAAKLVAARLLEEKAVKLDDIDKVVSVYANESQPKVEQTPASSEKTFGILGVTEPLPKDVIQHMLQQTKAYMKNTIPSKFHQPALPSEDAKMHASVEAISVRETYADTQYVDYTKGEIIIPLFDKSDKKLVIYSPDATEPSRYDWSAWEDPLLLCFAQKSNHMVVSENEKLCVVANETGAIDNSFDVNGRDVLLAFNHEQVMSDYCLVVTSDGRIGYHALLSDAKQPDHILTSGNPLANFHGSALHKDGLLLALWNDKEVMIVNLADLQAAPTMLKVNAQIPIEDSIIRVVFSGDGKTMFIQAGDALFPCDLRQDQLSVIDDPNLYFSRSKKLIWNPDPSGKLLVTVETHNDSKIVYTIIFDKKSGTWNRVYTQTVKDEGDYSGSLALFPYCENADESHLALLELTKGGVTRWSV